MIDKLSLVVVTYRQDLRLLERFLISVREYWQKDQLASILVIFNDKYQYYEECVSLLDTFDDLPILLKWSNHMWPEQESYSWYTQQQLKLLAADYINTSWYIIHDSKDYYKDHVNVDSFFDRTVGSCLLSPSRRFKDTWWAPGGLLATQYKNAYNLFGIDIRDVNFALRTRVASVFPANTQTVRDLLEFLRAKFGIMFPWLLLLQMNDEPLFTEYALLSAWYASKGNTYEHYMPVYIDESFVFLNRVACDKSLRGKLEI